MLDVSDTDKREETSTRVVLDKTAVPEPVGVYDRPERTFTLARMPLIIGIVIFLLLVLAALYTIF